MTHRAFEITCEIRFHFEQFIFSFIGVVEICILPMVGARKFKQHQFVDQRVPEIIQKTRFSTIQLTHSTRWGTPMGSIIF